MKTLKSMAMVAVIAFLAAIPEAGVCQNIVMGDVP